MALDDKQYMIADDSRRIDPDDPNSAYQPYYPDAIPFYENTVVKPLIDGSAYFKDLYCELNALKLNRDAGLSQPEDQRIYIAGWRFDKNHKLSDGTSDALLVDLLEEAAGAGVDVKVLLWVKGGVFEWDDEYTVGFENVRMKNITTVEYLRSIQPLENRVLINVLDHLYGSCHMKMVILSDKNDSMNRVIAYTGGIDFAPDRDAEPRHAYPRNHWHDIQARIEGEATVPIFDFFKEMWNELIDKMEAEKSDITPIFNEVTGELVRYEEAGYNNTEKLWAKGKFHHAVPEYASRFDPADTITPHVPGSATNIVQSLRTVPDKSTWNWSSPVWIYQYPVAETESSLQMAPAGIYEIQLAFKSAIEAATKYIYFENQYTHSRDILGYLKEAIIANPNLKVIFVTAASHLPAKFTDPLDEHNYYLYHYLFNAVPDDQKEQVKEQVVVYKTVSNYVHSKVMIVDDKFALIGSANISNRPLFSDFEHSISFIDGAIGNSVAAFRQILWAEHFRTSGNEETLIADLDKALRVWNDSWGASGAGFKLPSCAGSTYTDLTQNLDEYEGINFPASLFPLRIFGNSPEGRADSGGSNFLIDRQLPSHASLDLSGGWIYVMGGPNTGEFVHIQSHVDDRLNFSTTQADAFDGTTEYLLLFPVLQLTEVQEPVFDMTWKAALKEIGELP